MDILERVTEVLDSDTEYHTDKLKKIASIRPAFEKLAVLLQPEIEHEYVSIDEDELEVTFKTNKRAREVVRILLEKTTIEKFERTMEKSAWKDKVLWHYKAQLDGINIFIGPASPLKDCKPVRHKHVWHSWICEK